MDEFTITVNDTAENEIAALRELCTFHPDDPNLHMQLSRQLSKEGHEIGAIFAAREAYKIYSIENPAKAEALLYDFGNEITSENTQPSITGNYLNLAKHFGTIATYLRKVVLKEGQALFKEGDQAETIYLLLDGELSVNTMENGKFKLLNYLKAGSLVGEAALKEEEPIRSATVTANVDSTLLRLKPQELTDILKKDTGLSINFAKESMLRRHVTLLSSSELFARLPLDLRFMIAKRTWNLRYETGDIIKKADEYMHHAALLTKGSIQLLDDNTYCGRLKAGHMLGTGKLSGLAPSPLTFVAETPCKAVCMPYAVAEDIMEISPRFASEIKATMEMFTSQVNQTLMFKNTSS